MISIKLNSILEYIVSICIILSANSIYSRTEFSKVILIVLVLSLIGLAIISIRNLLRYRVVAIKTYIIITILFLYNTIFIIFNRANINSFIISYIFILNIFIIYIANNITRYEFDSVLFKFVKVVLVLSVISLMFYFLGSCFNIIHPNTNVIIEWGGIRQVEGYYNIHYNTQYISLSGIRICRNTGIFSEAPMYSFILSVAILIETFIKRKSSKQALVILMLTQFTTFSVTGIIVSNILIGLKIFFYKSGNKGNTIVKYLILLIITFLGLYIGGYFISQKINDSYGKMGSFAVRIDDIRVGIDLWKKNKLFGIGYSRDDLVKNNISTVYRGNDIGGSNGIITILSQCGIFLIIAYLIPCVISLLYSIKNKRMDNLIITCTLTILLFSTNIPYSYIIIYFIARSWSLMINSTPIKKIEKDT